MMGATVRSSVVDLEARLVGLCMVHPEAAVKASAALTETAVQDRVYRRMFAAIRKLVSEGKAPSSVAVVRELKGSIPDETLDWAIPHAIDVAGMPSELDAIIEAIQEAHARRALIAMADELRKAAEGAQDLEELQDLAARRAMQVASLLSGHDRPVRHIRDGLTDVVLALQDSAASARRIPFGFYTTLGRALHGLQARRLYVLAARPSMGKTALALQMAWQALERGGARNVLFVSLEMDMADIAARLLAQRTGVSLDAVMGWSLERRMQLVSQLQPHLAAISGLGLWVCDRRGLRASDIVAMAHRLALEEGGLDLVVIDHLGLIALPGGRDRTTAEKIGEVTRTLRRMAGDLNVPVLLLAQLNREVEYRDDKRPTMADLRGSGEIEQDADVILGLYRHRYYHPDLPDEDPRSQMAEVLVLKYRSGESGTAVLLRFNPSYVRFEEPPYAEQEAYEAAMRRAA